MKTSYLTVFLFAIALAVSASPAWAQHEHHERDGQAIVEKPDVVLHVKGLSCAMCARSLTNELKKLDAVDQVHVILEDDQRALVTLKTEKNVPEPELRKAVETAGFETRKVLFAGAKPSGDS